MRTSVARTSESRCPGAWSSLPRSASMTAAPRGVRLRMSTTAEASTTASGTPAVPSFSQGSVDVLAVNRGTGSPTKFIEPGIGLGGAKRGDYGGLGQARDVEL